ncbi:MAG: hypothetical protein IAI48_16825 [Candidatus Eremiobacteraeota bacterium]|nr:hypothetical protein [Candidatus Eremiobacteraeota bacterium]
MADDVAREIVALARARGKRSIAVVGTSKNAGKTVVTSALAHALGSDGVRYGLCSIGRDGEAFDALEGGAKPRFALRPGATIATAAALVPRTPALEIYAMTDERSALGRIVLARVRAPGEFEIAGPPSAEASRRIAIALGESTDFTLVDGAVDRLAAVRGDDAIVVAVGAHAAPTPERAVDDAAALVAKLRLPLARAGDAALRIDGALTAAAAADLVRSGETRAVVVRDATHVAFGGKTYLTLAARLDLRCDRALHPVACTVAPFSWARAFEPRAFARSVAARTGLPVFDVYAGTVARPAA